MLNTYDNFTLYQYFGQYKQIQNGGTETVVDTKVHVFFSFGWNIDIE